MCEQRLALGPPSAGSLDTIPPTRTEKEKSGRKRKERGPRERQSVGLQSAMVRRRLAWGLGGLVVWRSARPSLKRGRFGESARTSRSLARRRGKSQWTVRRVCASILGPLAQACGLVFCRPFPSPALPAAPAVRLPPAQKCQDARHSGTQKRDLPTSPAAEAAAKLVGLSLPWLEASPGRGSKERPQAPWVLGAFPWLSLSPAWVQSEPWQR